MEPSRYRPAGMYTNEFEASSSGVTRKRNASSSFEEDAGSNEGIYEELEKLRSLVDEVDGDHHTSTRGTIDGSLMSTVFGVVLVMIISITIYAFTNLYKAVMKRFSEK